MAEKEKLGSMKRFGTRYGPRNKKKVAAIEKLHRGRHKCPFCNYVKVTRLSKGIWQCEKCNAKFTGKAYTYTSPKKVIEELMEEKAKSEPDEEVA